MSAELSNPNDTIDNLAIGKIIEVDGSHIVAELEPTLSELSRVFAGETYPIGQFGSIVKIHFGRRLIFAFVGRLRMKAEYEGERGIVMQASGDERIVEADLFGEGEWVLDSAATPPKWTLRFERGVTTYPLPQQTVYLTPKSELRHIYGQGKGKAVCLGEHVGSGGTPCYAEMNELLGKHTAVLGSTGAGKSGTVAAILHSVLERGETAHHPNWQPTIIILDPHNEYGNAFQNHKRLSTDEGTLSLPYWMLNLDETIALFIGKTEYAATSQSNIVKNALLVARRAGAEKIPGLDVAKLNVDAPVPYLLGVPTGLDEFGKVNGASYEVGFVGAVNAQRPDNKNKKEHEDFNKVLRKLESLLKDARNQFMMQPWDGLTDPLPDVLGQLMGGAQPLRIVDLSGVPNEVAGTASAAIARTLFLLKVWQTPTEREKSPVLLVCEEAHRYVPNVGAAQYEAAQEAVRRIAKEGRKYGLGLMLVSQRPSEVEATVLSQCNSWVVLRITNDADREHVRSILPDSMAGLVKMLSGLRRQEAIFVGQAAMLPARILVRSLEPSQLPRSHDIDFDAGWQNNPMSRDQLNNVAERWRYQKR
ncbi:ATP-binding protein [Myxococcota bacterium]|nr:ATP-binding protein [Myxococcota bacterium]